MDMTNLMRALLERGLSEGCYPGAVAACGDQGHVYALSAVGKIANDGPNATAETRYDMASLTKVLGPTMVGLRAIEDGDLTLDDPLARFFEEVPQDKRDITVFQLMTHTAGFTPSFRIEREADAPQDALRAIFARPLDGRPGEKPSYSCIGYITFAKLLERVYGQGIDTLTRERVFAPLGMTHTGYCPAGGNIASTEIDPDTGRALCGVVHDENARFLGGVSGNAGIFSDVYDMIAFAQMLADGGGGYLSPAMLARATRCYTDGFDAHRGLGFHLGGTPCSFMGDLFPPCSFGHTGFTGTSLVVDPTTGFFVVLLTNRVHPTRESAGLFRFRRAFHNALYAAFSRADDQKTSFSLKNLHK